ncbi:glycosyltransferase [Oceaniglobus indicus]|uniref:glycosyltransferase n=1 Tax=Oceaniglobus indicus TaxID=2047749 RepID=UPI000C183BFD|nr:glycosyltransferase [Oceaniglobus indicus]
MTRRLLLLINSLEGGGAEKVMAALADHLAQTRSDLDIRLALLDDRAIAHPPASPVRVVQLDGRGGFWRSIRAVRRTITDWQPDIVLSFLTRANCAAVLGRSAGRFRCIISERVHTTSHLGTGLRARVLRGVVRHLYPRADAVIAVSQGVADELKRTYGVDDARLHTIANPIDADRLHALGAEAPPIPLPADFLVSVGRLVPNKDGETLLRAFARQSNRSRALVMLGDGPERARLDALARDLGIGARVLMPGYVRNPHAVVARATAYVSASRSEGFPNALVEAMALGRPVVSTDCASGPAEILADRREGATVALEQARWGLLVPMNAPAALAAAMDLLDDAGTRATYGARAAERAKDYAPAAVFARYTEVLTP